MKRIQKIMIAGIFFLAVSAAFASKGINKPLITDVYGEVDNNCQALCATTGSNTCTATSSDGWFLSLANCQNQTSPYSGNRFALP